MSSSEHITDGLQALSNDIVKYAVIVAAVATVSMAIIEVIKSSLRLKGIFLRNHIRKWIKDQAARDELVSLAAGTTDCQTPLDWWDQPSEKVFAQIRTAAGITLDFPNNYPKLYAFLMQGVPESAKWKESAENWRGGPTRLTPNESTQLSALHVRLNRVANQRIDTLQVRFDWSFAKVSQIAAFVGSAILLTVFYLQGKSTPLEAVCVGTLGGFLAPFAKDIVSRLTEVQLRRYL